jgi:glucosyl-dolichyl phosphate glucuronosyltransferase
MIHYPSISIIIPTYNRALLLSLTVDSFLAQNYPKDKVEIILANNNSTDNTREIIDSYCAKHTQIRSVPESRQGVHYARNSAAEQARGDLLYFTDDDMIADPNLLQEIVRPFGMDEKVATVTGKVLPKWEVPPPQWILDFCVNRWLSLLDPPEDLIISRIDFNVYSCHQAVRRDIFLQSGGFNPENTAGEWIGDGETGLNLKIKDLGYKFAYISSSVTRHIIPPVRMTQEYFNKRVGNQGNCDSYTLYRKHRHGSAAMCWAILRNGLDLLHRWSLFAANYLLGRDKWRVHRAYMSYYAKRMKYDYRIITDENWRNLVLTDDWLHK